MVKKTPMTIYGAEKLREELQNLKSVERPKIIAAISEARAHGDLKENAEYHAAKERQSFIEGRVIELENKLNNAEIIDITTLDAGGRVVFGATVTVANVETDEETTYQIVGEDEANIQAGKISIYSPIARGLIGKEQGDSVEVRVPAGRMEYEIIDVQYK